MAQISEVALKTTTGKELKFAIRSMNPVTKKYGIAVAPKGNKAQMAAAIVDSVEHVISSDATGKGLNQFVDTVKTMYLTLTSGPGEENATSGESGHQAAKDGGNGEAEAATKPTRRTRGAVFAQMLASGAFPPGNRKEWAALYLEEYGGSENEAAFRVNVYCDLLVHMGMVEVDEKGVNTYIG